MAGAPAYLIDSLRRFEAPFKIDDVANMHPDLSRDTIRVYLSMATTDGSLTRVGVGTYKLAEPTMEGVSAYPPLEKLQANLLPSAWRQLVVWSDQDVAGFVHDAIMAPFIVIEASKKSISTVREVLERNGTATIELRNRRHLAQALREGSRQKRFQSEGPVVLVPNEGFSGTRPCEHGYRIPEPERLFLDFLGEDPYALDFLADASPRYGLDPIRLLKAASPRKRTGEIASMLTTLIALHPDHPMRPELESRWPWIARLP